MNPDKAELAENMLNALRRAEELYVELKHSPNDLEVRERAGYGILHAARRKVEDHFHATTGKHDIAPRLRSNICVTDSIAEVSGFVRDVLADDVHAEPLADYVLAMRNEGNLRQEATYAIRAAVGLLGDTYGGWFAKWQLSTLALDVMTCVDQELLNRKVRHAIEANLEEGCELADKYDLPCPHYVLLGCNGNIAKAAWRSIAVDDNDPRGFDALFQLGSDALDAIRVEVDLDNDPNHIGSMHAMRAAVADHLGKHDIARRFWSMVSSDQAIALVKTIEGMEPCEDLIGMVARSVESAFSATGV